MTVAVSQTIDVMTIAVVSSVMTTVVASNVTEEERGGFRNDRRDDNRGGFKRNNDRGNFRKDARSNGDRLAPLASVSKTLVPRPVRHNPGDLRISNRADRSQSPDIDEDVTGKELDRVARAQLRYLEERSASWVAKHLVMTGRLLRRRRSSRVSAPWPLLAVVAVWQWFAKQLASLPTTLASTPMHCANCAHTAVSPVRITTFH